MKTNERRGLRRPCKRCGKMFQPTGGACKICENCKLPHWNLKANRANRKKLKTKK